MPLPTPKKDDSHNDFMSRCMSNGTMKDEFPDTDQRYAVCEKQWEKRKNMKNKRRKVLFHLSTNLSNERVKKENFDDDSFDAYDTVMIVGDGTYNGVYFPKEELSKGKESFEGVPININHNDDTIEDVVGYVKDVQYKNGKLYAKTLFDKRTSKYDTVNGFIKSRQDSGDIPNVSIGVWLELEEEKLDDGTTRTTARNLEGDHLAVVVHGACNPDDGCGIGMSQYLSGEYLSKPTGEYVHIPEYEIQVEVNPKTNDDEINLEELKKNIYQELIKKERFKHE